ncbi:MAG: type II toxin-antitoxin system prevent-host-death family antitoxin [Microbacteriaceae bacterium]|nr:type II toxin-antitoxin system prevent-host-death family antitoxin [Microbacteriaceae bacterium]
MNIQDAKTQLSKLIAAAERGEEVVIARAGKPAVRLVPIEPPRQRKFGTLAGLVPPIPDSAFFDPLPEEELELWYR